MLDLVILILFPASNESKTEDDDTKGCSSWEAKIPEEDVYLEDIDGNYMSVVPREDAISYAKKNNMKLISITPNVSHPQGLYVVRLAPAKRKRYRHSRTTSHADSIADSNSKKNCNKPSPVISI
jgi:translation initiation factor IF-3